MNSISKITPPMDLFKENVLDLVNWLSDLISYIYDQGYRNIPAPTIVKMAVNFIEKQTSKVMIETFIDKSYSHWDQIEKKEEQFFFDNISTIFGDLPLTALDAFKSLFLLTDNKGNKVVDVDDREYIWDAFNTLIQLSVRYIHEQRQPSLRLVNGKQQPCYNNASYKIDINIAPHVQHYNMQLVFSD